MNESSDNNNVIPLFTSPLSPSLTHILELILTHGREEVQIPYGMTGPASINQKTLSYLQSFGAGLAQLTFIEGPFIDEISHDKYWVLWYKHEYESAYATIQAQRKQRDLLRSEFNARLEHKEKAFLKFCELHHHDTESEYKRKLARGMFDELVKWAEKDDDTYAAELLKGYGYYDKE